MRRSFGTVLGVIILAIILPQSAKMADATIGTIYTVNTTNDELNTDGDCSLREAVIAANTNTAVDACPAGSSTATDTITLMDGATYVLSIAGSEDAAVMGDLDLADNPAETDL